MRGWRACSVTPAAIRSRHGRAAPSGQESGLLHLPRGSRRPVQREQARTAVGRRAARMRPLARTATAPTHTLSKKDSRLADVLRAMCPTLCAQCHRTGQKAAVRYSGKQTNIVENYLESIHGRGLMQAGLTVTANCADCHTAHHELPAAIRDPASTEANIARTCAQCHRGIYELFTASVHSPQGDAHRQGTAGVQPIAIPRTAFSGRTCPISGCTSWTSAAAVTRPSRKLLRDVPREGFQAGLPGYRQVLRLSRLARHSAGDRSALASQPRQHCPDLRQMPHRLAPPVRGISDSRHAPRSASAIRSCSTPSGA